MNFSSYLACKGTNDKPTWLQLRPLVQYDGGRVRHFLCRMVSLYINDTVMDHTIWMLSYRVVCKHFEGLSYLSRGYNMRRNVFILYKMCISYGE